MKTYLNTFRIKLKPSKLTFLDQAIKEYNKEYNIGLRYTKSNITKHKGMLYIDAVFNSLVFLLSSETYFVMFDFARYFRDAELELF